MHRRELRLSSQRQAILHEDKRHWNRNRRNGPENRHRGTDSQIVEHRHCDKRKCSPHEASQKRVGRHCRSSIKTVGVDEEVDTLLEDHVEASSDETSSEDWRDPRDFRIRRPSEPLRPISTPNWDEKEKVG